MINEIIDKINNNENKQNELQKPNKQEGKMLCSEEELVNEFSTKEESNKDVNEDKQTSDSNENHAAISAFFGKAYQRGMSLPQTAAWQPPFI